MFKRSDVEKELMLTGLKPRYTGFRYIVDLFMLFSQNTKTPLSDCMPVICTEYGLNSKSVHSTIYYCFKCSGVDLTMKEILFDVYYNLKEKYENESNRR